MDPAELFFIYHSFRRQANAGAKPSTDIEDILLKAGAHPIGLPRAYYKHDKAVHLRDIVNSAIVRLAMPHGKSIILQYPAQYQISNLATLAKKRHNRLIVWVHDINELRGLPQSDHPDVLSLADIIIAHTPAMKDWLSRRYPNAEIFVLGMFDYLLDEIPQAPAPHTKSIVFAGNLAKSTFLQHLNFPDDLRLVLYGIGAPENLISKPFVDYRGSCMPEQIPARICGETFGLVWDGDSTQSCSGPMGQYLRYNAPYKLSSYIAAGIPVIIWDQMGIAPFVEQHGIGIAVPDLDSLPQTIEAIPPARYDQMRQSARNLSQQITKGHQTLNILKNVST